MGLRPRHPTCTRGLFSRSCFVKAPALNSCVSRWSNSYLPLANWTAGIEIRSTERSLVKSASGLFIDIKGYLRMFSNGLKVLSASGRGICAFSRVLLTDSLSPNAFALNLMCLGSSVQMQLSFYPGPKIVINFDHYFFSSNTPASH